MHERVRRGVVVRSGHVPGDHRHRPEAEADERPQQDREERAQGAERGKRAQKHRRKQEEQERPPHGGHEQRGRRIADQDVLEHVRREQLLVADVVERRDERHDEQRQARREEQRPGPRRVLGTPPAEAHEGLDEEHERQGRADQDHRRRLPGRGQVGARQGGVRLTDTSRFDTPAPAS